VAAEPGLRASLLGILADVGRLDAERAGGDLRAAGLTSLAAARVVVAIEERYGFQFPDELLVQGLFESLDGLERAVASVLAGHGGG
jgi:acyl carrier protein